MNHAEWNFRPVLNRRFRLFVPTVEGMRNFCTHSVVLMSLVVVLSGAGCQSVFAQGLHMATPAHHHPNWGRYAASAFKVIAGVAATLGILNAVFEWSASGRKRRAIDRVIRLSDFIDAARKISEGGNSQTVISEEEIAAREELNEAVRGCYPARVAPTGIRRLLLIYLPPRKIAFLPHVLFFSLWALLADMFYDFSPGGIANFRTKEFATLLIGFFCLILFAQRWASIELRRAYGEDIAPSRLVFGLYWYRGNTFWGLLSNAYLVLGVLELFVWFAGLLTSGSNISVSAAWPTWQSIVTMIVGMPWIILAYYWTRAEYFIGHKSILRFTFPELIERARDLRFPERLVGLLGLVALSVWCIVLIFDVRYAAAIAAFPDGSVSTIGVSGALSWIISRFFFMGAFPWLAVYRGLPLLFNYEPLSIEGVQHGGK